MDLKDKVVLITGSTRGIGAATAKSFASQGAKTILHGHRQALPENLEEALKAIKADYKYLSADLSDDDTVKQLAKDAWNVFGNIDILVNNAGITKDKLMMGMKAADFDAVININLRAPFILSQLIMKKMLKQKSGVIVNLASIVGIHGNVGQANYAASKAGLIGLTKTIAQEGALRGIRCNAVAPGMIESDMTANLSDRVKEQILEKIPLKRLGLTDEVADTIVFLAKNDYITGQTIIVDGGMTI